MVKRHSRLVIVGLIAGIVLMLSPIQVSASIHLKLFNYAASPALHNPGFDEGLNSWTEISGNWDPRSGNTYALTDEDDDGTAESIRAWGLSALVCKLEQEINDGTVTRVRGKYIEFSFYFKSYDDRARAVLVIDDSTYYGDWATHGHGEMPWSRASIIKYVPTSCDSIKVRIEAQDTGSVSTTISYVDATELAIIEKKPCYTTSYGSYSWRIRVVEVRESAGYNYAYVWIAVAAEAKEVDSLRKYFIQLITIQCNRYQTSSSSYHEVEAIGEMNNIEKYALPGAGDEYILAGTEIAASLASSVIGAAVGALSGGNPIVGGAAGVIAGVALEPLMYQYAQDSMSGDNSAFYWDLQTKITWFHNYFTEFDLSPDPEADVLPRRGAWSHFLLWKYKPTSGNKMKITFTIKFAEIQYYSDWGGFGWCTQTVQTITKSTYLYGY